MFDLASIIDTPPFSLASADKARLHGEALSALTRHHYAACPPYRAVLDAIGFDVEQEHAAGEIPFLPVRLFKTHELVSVDRGAVFKTMTSSGTTGQSVSRIFLDRATAANQTRVLAKITASFLGPRRLPMLVVDTRAVVKDRSLFSARGAGILGFSMLGHDVTYALNDDMSLDAPAVEAFVDRHRDGEILLFGFTSIIWEHFQQALVREGRRLPLERGIMIHGGGWKKLAALAVDNDAFKQRLREVCGIGKVLNYYGMVEQTGSIFMECEHGRIHSPIFSDVIARRHTDFSPCGIGERGLLQLVSLLPSSYPGHSILTEDVGAVTGEDDCPCGRKGRTLVIEGRVAQAEIRGCSDTYVSRS